MRAAESTAPPLQWSGGGLPLGRVALMGILNVTPDSFFDGGRHAQLDAALQRADEMLGQGADLVDIGGESTRPGAEEIDADEELRRVTPVLEALAARGFPLPLSVDTSRAVVARAATARGAVIINDVTAGVRDPALLDVVAMSGAAVILMHTRGTPRTMAAQQDYDDVVAEVGAALSARLDAANRAGIPPERQCVDPGIGFAKGANDSLRLIARLRALSALSRPILLGASRKSFLGQLFHQDQEARLYGSLAVAGWGALHGAQIVRVHDVAATRATLDVVAALAHERRANRGDPPRPLSHSPMDR